MRQPDADTDGRPSTDGVPPARPPTALQNILNQHGIPRLKS
ncbi:hypothetical protein ACIA6D_41160 [Streptomyces cacaoi]